MHTQRSHHVVNTIIPTPNGPITNTSMIRTHTPRTRAAFPHLNRKFLWRRLYRQIYLQHSTHQKDGNILLRGWRYPPSLWHLPLTNADTDTTHNTPKLHNEYQNTTKDKHMQYLHADAFILVPATWIKAIQNGFSPPSPALRSSQ